VRKWELDKTQRMQLKAWICILGAILLAVLVLVKGLLLFWKWWNEFQYEPVKRKICNVWIMDVTDADVLVFEEGQERQYRFAKEFVGKTAEGFLTASDLREQVADIYLADECVTQIVCKAQKINGKVLAFEDSFVVIEGYGRMEFSDSVRGYRLYNKLSMCTARDMFIGYDFADFVVENGKICAILMAKEGTMEYIRVLLKNTDYQGIYHDKLTFSCDTDYMIVYGEGENEMREIHRAKEEVKLDRESAYFQTDRVKIVPSALTGRITMQEIVRNQGTAAYRGSVELLLTPDGIIAINEVLLEDYLYSVVPSEMPASYPAQALNAQAVCARTYAYSHMLHAGYPQFGAHVDDSTGYQVYNNIPEQEATTAAVKDTFGRILCQEGGALEEIYYYSTSCGVGTESSIWSAESWEIMYDASKEANLADEKKFYDYIHTKDTDHYEALESWYRWSYQVEMPDPKILRARLEKRYEANPAHVLLLQRDGSYESISVKKWKDFEQINEIAGLARGMGGGVHGRIIVTDTDTFKVITEYSIRFVLCDGKTKVQRQDGSLANANTLLPSGFFVIETTKEKEAVSSYRLTGGGYGHGVGMSQNGARRMADTGMTAQEILNYYFTGCQMKNIY